ncbi:MAG: hypothetical protein HQK49_17530 [Oligoflexia bacterium]|nr:hypothetical protein [Oligoflexia bacterium]
MKRTLILLSLLTFMFTILLPSFNNANATTNPYQLCLQEAFLKHDNAVRNEMDNMLSEKKRCYQYPFESSRYIDCIISVEKRHNENLQDFDQELNKDKRACFQFIE